MDQLIDNEYQEEVLVTFNRPNDQMKVVIL